MIEYRRSGLFVPSLVVGTRPWTVVSTATATLSLDSLLFIWRPLFPFRPLIVLSVRADDSMSSPAASCRCEKFPHF
ncbi:hypothetical protein ARMSODRAFT_608677 [Armillaria solidipes]|uniref:Uncharacterized protein n=1 Tax=Armillaria solidipes TaxID=1076256 RepID=A0A2H3AU68_9AGAR|nr:hypothetical protein ARMSODRAFT_608677 [Armillaria solidipes]